MKNTVSKISRKVCLFIINNFFSTTRYFKLKRCLLNFSGIKVGKDTKVVGPLFIGTVATLTIGEGCWIGSGLNIYGNGNVVIGDRCDIAPDVSFVTGSHEIGGVERRAGKGVSYEIEIENGCWIGARTTIMGNTIISYSTIIGSASLVNKSIPPNVIALGIPAKTIKDISHI